MALAQKEDLTKLHRIGLMMPMFLGSTIIPCSSSFIPALFSFLLNYTRHFFPHLHFILVQTSRCFCRSCQVCVICVLMRPSADSHISKVRHLRIYNICALTRNCQGLLFKVVVSIPSRRQDEGWKGWHIWATKFCLEMAVVECLELVGIVKVE